MAELDARGITRALGGRWHGSYGTACCPAHDDRRPSLSLRDGRDGRLLAYCHAGCGWTAVADALRARGLMAGQGSGQRGAAAPDLAARAAREREEREEARKRGRQARWCWKGTRPIEGTPAEAYLRGRGIAGPLPRTLRFHPACWHAPTARKRPALVALVQGTNSADGVPSAPGVPSTFAVHRTYLTAKGRKLEPAGDAKLSLGPVLGGAVRLSEGRRGPGGGAALLVAAEGIETALSVAQGAAGEVPPAAVVWAALSTSGLAGLVLPPVPGRLLVAADADEAGRDAARALAARARKAGWDAAIRAAPEGRDWNDVLRERACA